jgi:hypothetical protein
MAHSQKAHGQKAAMKQFNEGHHVKEMGMLSSADGKYTSGEMDNPEHLKKSVEGLAGYAKKHKMQYP